MVGATAPGTVRAMPRRAAKRTDRTPVGIPGDQYVVELRGTSSYYVLDARNRGIMGGPYRTREQAQSRADMLNLTRSRR
jgi:hypothetical protein